MSIPSRSIPQTRNLGTLRLIVEAIAEGCDDLAYLGEISELSPRHLDYALAAAETLGWIMREDGELRSTDAGRRLVATRRGSDDEREWMRCSLEASPLHQHVAHDLLSPVAPTKSTLIRRIRAQSEQPIARSTAEHRAAALLAWRTQLLGKEQLILWPKTRLPDELVRNILRENPWWQNKPGKVLPPVERDFVSDIRSRIEAELAPIVAVRGPRQVGKTTAQLQIIEELLARGVNAGRILRVQWDDLPSLKGVKEPILRVVEWYVEEVLRDSLNAAARRGEPAYLFFDEVQNLSDWPMQLKHLVDSSTVAVIVTGSSALRIEAGRDSLAGRLSTIEVGTLSLREIAAIRKIGTASPILNPTSLQDLASFDFWHMVRKNGDAHAELRDEAFKHFSDRGGYPLVHQRAQAPWPQVADQLNENVIRKVIQHDLRVGERGRKRDPALLEELFRLCCRYAGQTPSIRNLTREIRETLHANVGEQRVRAYLEFLHLTLLLRLVKPLEIRLKRARAPAKVCLADHGLRASWLQEYVPIHAGGLNDNNHAAGLAGHLAESIFGAYLLSIPGLDIAHFPGTSVEPEVDFVLTVGDKRIPIEVKYRKRIRDADLNGVRAFMAKSVYRAPFGLVITREDVDFTPDPGILHIPLSSLLLMR